MSNPAEPAVKWDSERIEVPCFLKDGETQGKVDIVINTTDERPGFALLKRIDLKGQDPAIFGSVSSDVHHFMQTEFSSYESEIKIK